MSLHARIMNIASKPGVHSVTDATRNAYAEGHRDARRAVAELALEADAEIERLRANAARMDWLSAPGNATLISEWFYPEDRQHLRAFIDWCAAGNDPREFKAKG